MKSTDLQSGITESSTDPPASCGCGQWVMVSESVVTGLVA